jgi:hypothetical protein
LRQAALLVRVVTVGGCLNRYYGCLLDVDGNFLAVAEWNDQCVTATSTWTTTSAQSLDVWYSLTAVMQGNTLTCTVSGGDLSQPYSSALTDLSDIITAGSVGLAAWDIAASFDDLVVEAL